MKRDEDFIIELIIWNYEQDQKADFIFAHILIFILFFLIPVSLYILILLYPIYYLVNKWGNFWSSDEIRSSLCEN